MAILNPNQPGQVQNFGQGQVNNTPGQPLQQVQNAGSSSSVAPVNAGGSAQSGAQGGSQPATIQSSYNPNKQQGSGYTNIQKVMQANQGNQLGQTVGQNLQTNLSGAQQNLSNAQQQFNDQSNQNQANTEANQKLTQDVLANPTQYASSDQVNSNPQAVQQFQSLLSGQYQGPTQLQNSNQLQSQAANAQQQAQALGSSSGRIGLLQQMFNNPQYGQGEQNLDSLLLGQSNNKGLQQASQNAAKFNNQVGSALVGAQNQGQQATAQAQQFGQSLQNQLGSNVSNLNNTLQDQAQQLQTSQDQNYQKTLKDLASGTISQQEADLLGLTQGENVYNLFNQQGVTGANSPGAAGFLQENPLQATAQNVANKDQYAQLQALQQLAGQYAPQTAQNLFAQYQNPSQANAFQNASPINANQSAFQNALQGTQSNYKSIYDPAINGLQGAQNELFLNQQDQTAHEQLRDPARFGTTADQLNQLIATDEQQLGQMGAQAAGVGYGTPESIAFAQNMLGTRQNEYNNAMSQLNQQYGSTPEQIYIQPSNYTALAGLKPQNPGVKNG